MPLGPLRAPKKAPDEDFFEKKSRVQSIGNCLICLDPKSCIFTFFEKLRKFLCRASGTYLKFTVRHILKESSKIYSDFFQLDVVQTNAHNF